MNDKELKKNRIHFRLSLIMAMVHASMAAVDMESTEELKECIENIKLDLAEIEKELGNG